MKQIGIALLVAIGKIPELLLKGIMLSLILGTFIGIPLFALYSLWTQFGWKIAVGTFLGAALLLLASNDR